MTKTRIAAGIILIFGALLGFFVFQSEVKEDGSLPPIKYGLDLAGGTHLVYQADVSQLERSEISPAMEALRNVIERRVNAFGVSEPLVQVEEGGFGGETKYRLIVELPGVKDVEEAKAAIGETPVLEFKLLKEGATLPPPGATTTVGTSTDERFEDTGLTGRYLQDAQMQFGQGQGLSNEPIVLVEFNAEGAELFAEITRNNVGRNLAIFLDGEMISAPVLREEITGGTAQISGNFSPEEAKRLERDLDLGALPVPIELVTQQTIGSTLGEETKDAGTKAGIIGLLAVGLFMLLWYRVPGIVAVTALAIYLFIMLAIFKLVPVVLTSAGIAGFILSIGMAVDANVLIFERMKEELRDESASEKSMQKSIEDGFSRAWPSIRDANISSLITAVILFYIVGTALTKGFAVTFGIGVLISMITAISISRTLLLAFAGEEYTSTKRLLFGSGFDTQGSNGKSEK